MLNSDVQNRDPPFGGLRIKVATSTKLGTLRTMRQVPAVLVVKMGRPPNMVGIPFSVPFKTHPAQNGLEFALPDQLMICLANGSQLPHS